ncbi:hypothetical protein A0H81_11229 [Grifola frondosa]|uniref:DUF6534 domain-containing protein n=1 Tax=Grifola frondosa TaxID=5627 RepID=A0A1C7LVP9_GRIFR|nr:hypothetical protein A0H81_11229 [Grifola frondosa]
MTGPNLHLDPSIGCVFIGVLFGIIFYTCTVVQTVYYYRKYPKDRTHPLDFGHRYHVTGLGGERQVFAYAEQEVTLPTQVLWYFTVASHGNPINLLSVPKTFVSEFMLISFTIFVVQCYFVHNIWRLLKDKSYRVPLTLFGLALAAAGVTGGAGTSYKLSINSSDAIAIPSVKVWTVLKLGGSFGLTFTQVPASIQQVASIVCDAYITISLCLVLRETRTGFKKTNMLLNKLTMYAMNRGMLTSTIQLCHFVLYIATVGKIDLLWMVFHIPGNKVYVNSLLAVLNVRQYLREVSTQRGTNTLELVDLTGSQAPSSLSDRSKRTDPRFASSSGSGIMYKKEVIKMRDDGSNV